MPLQNVPPTEFFARNGRSIYLIHPDDLVDNGLRTYWFGSEQNATDEGSFDVRVLPGWHLISQHLRGGNPAEREDELIRRTLTAHTVLNLLPEAHGGYGPLGDQVPFGPFLAYTELHAYLSECAEDGLPPDGQLLADCLHIMSAVTPADQPYINFMPVPLTVDEEDMKACRIYPVKADQIACAVKTVRAHHGITVGDKRSLADLARDVSPRELAVFEGVQAVDATLQELQDAGLAEHSYGYLHVLDAEIVGVGHGK